jgi:hypothetical protein
MINYYGQYISADTEADILALAGKPGDVAYAQDTKLRYMYNGSSWFPTDALRVVKSTATVDAKTVAATKIITLPNTVFRFVAIAAHIEVVTLTGTVVVQPSLSIGTNSTAYNNLFTSSILTGTLTAVGLMSPAALSVANAIAPLAGGTDVYARVNIATTGATVYALTIDLMGYFKV